jgi:enhancer of polycomb-like protein
LARIKEKDQQHWEDGIDNPYQSRPVPWAERLYKYIAGPRSRQSSSSDEDDTPRRDPHALRLRAGRGGRMHLDRRRPPSSAHRIRTDFIQSSEDVEEMERQRRLRERWMFDEDDGPALGPDGPDEHDRVLFDDFRVKCVNQYLPSSSIN